MEKLKCTYCGNNSPASPDETTTLPTGSNSPTFMSWDSLDAHSYIAVPTEPVEVPEPSLDDPMYRGLWDFLAFTAVGISSVCIWYLIDPRHIPWFTIVIGFFALLWATYSHLRKITPELSPTQKTDILFNLHKTLAAITFIFCLSLWLLLRHWKTPWFLFAGSASYFLLTIHYSISYLDLKRLWLLPQLHIYFISIVTCFFVWIFTSPPGTPAWWLWPAGIGAIVISCELVIWLIVMKRKIKNSHNLTPEERHRIALKNTIGSIYQSIQRSPTGSMRITSAEVPLLVGMDHELMEAPSVLAEHNSQKLMLPKPSSKLGPAVVGGRLAPGTPAYVHNSSLNGANHSKQSKNQINTSPIMVAVPTVNIDAGADDAASTPLVEYVASPPVSKLGSQHIRNVRSPKRSSIRVVHHDDDSAEVVDTASSYTGDGELTIDVIHIPQVSHHSRKVSK